MEFFGLGLGTFVGTVLGLFVAWALTLVFPSLEDATLFLASVVAIGFVVGLVADAFSRKG